MKKKYTIPIRKMLYYRRLFLGAAVVTILYILLFYSRSSQVDIDRKTQLALINKLIESNVGSETCKMPLLPVNSSDVMAFFKDVPPIDCSSVEPDWIIVEGSECKISKVARKRHISITCTYTYLMRIDEFHSQNGRNFTVTDISFTLRDSDVVQVFCKSSYTYKSWQSILTGIRQDPEITERTGWSYLPPEALRYNVLMFGFDSLSRNTFIRKLPKSYKYLTEVLKADVLEGYNIIGDGTPQALIPILTGKTELELPDARKRIAGSANVDVYPFIWKDFRKYGYVTGFLEDVCQYGTFTYRLNGFKDPPTDHYMRPYYVATTPNFGHYPNYCYGSIPRHKIMMNYVKNFFLTYKDKPKFMFGFHGELSHDSYNLIGAADDDFLAFLMNLNDEGYLKDTILIAMADHGHRFAAIRNTIQGKLEERLPFFSFTFPQSFKTKHKEAYNNFVNNKQVLITPFDIHGTFKNILNFGEQGAADLTQRSLSLFNQISKKRSCSDAYIEPHWCACLDWHEIPPDSPIIPKLAAVFVDKLNDYTEPYRNLCEKLSLKQIFWATELIPNDKLVSFKKNADLDGFVADLSSKMKVNKNMYQIKVQLEPGDSLFEVSISNLKGENGWQISMDDISRINMYGKQARCIENKFHHLRKYCYCKDSL